MIERETYLDESFCQDEQRRKIVNIDLFHFNRDQWEQQRLGKRLRRALGFHRSREGVRDAGGGHALLSHSLWSLLW